MSNEKDNNIKNNLNLIHWNCFKLTYDRCNELKLFLGKYKPDIVSLNEIKLNEYECNYSLNF